MALRWFRNMSIKRKLLLSFSVIVVLPVLITLQISDRLIDQFVLTKIGQNHSDLVSDYTKSLNRMMDDMTFALLSISNSDQVKTLISGQTADSYSTLRTQKIIDNAFENVPMSLSLMNARITIISTQAAVYANWNDYTAFASGLPAESWYQSLMASGSGSICWLGLKMRVSGGKHTPFLEAAIPVSSGRDSAQRIGLVHISIEAGTLFNNLIPDHRDADVYLTDSRGGILAARDLAGEDQRIQDVLDFESIRAHPDTWTIGESPDGRKIVMTGYRADKAGWLLISVIPYHVLMAPLSHLRTVLLLVNILVMLAFLLMVLGIADVISRPLVRLNRSIRSVENGNFSEKVVVTGNDEIGTLSRNFNHMLDKVSSLIEITRVQEQMKREAEFEALQAQINPHFLFNTLSSIRWAAAAAGDEKAEAMVHALAVLLRSSICPGQAMISLAEEIRISENYLNLCRMKQNSHFTLNQRIEAPVLKYQIPHLLLQPLIENAVLHGFDGLQGEGIIEVSATVEADILTLVITDNGQGVHGATLEEILARRDPEKEKQEFNRSVGLKNIYDRIRLIYGPKYGLDIRDGAQGGTCVTLWLPYESEVTPHADPDAH